MGTCFNRVFPYICAFKGHEWQVVVDFIVDHAMDETPLNYLEMEPWKLYFDGFSHKNVTGVGILIVSPNKISNKFKYRINGSCLNNEAEYEALIAGLGILLELGAKRVKIKGDSELVVTHIMKEYYVLRRA